MTRCIIADGHLIDDLPAWEAILGWLRHHGIDPEALPATNVIAVDDIRRQIRFASYERGGDGQWVIAADGARLVTRQRVLQLEAPALPFPAVASRWCLPGGGAV